MARESSVARVTEIIASSPKSFQDAIDNGLKRANKTLKNIRGVWVKSMNIELDGKNVTAYRVDLHVTFVLKD